MSDNTDILYNIATSYICAEGFFRSGCELYDKFHACMFDGDNEGKADDDTPMVYAIPSVVNLTFSLELYLKNHLVQLSCYQYTRTHDLLKLFQALPKAVQEKINDRFLLNHSENQRHSEPNYTTLTFGKAKEREDTETAETITQFLDRYRNAFTLW